MSNGALPQVVVCGGYRIPARHYASIVESFVAAGYGAPVVVEQLDVDDGETLGESAQRVLQRVGKGVVVLVGHSRGGAVALRAALSLKGRAMSLILVDPVDDGESSSISLAVSSPPSALPSRVLIISTPYAGASAFYHQNYESACAPAGRNGDSFASALGDCAVHLTLPNTGHLEFLDFRKDLAVSNLCGPSSKLAPETTRKLDKAVLRLLTDFAKTQGKGLELDLEELKEIDPQIIGLT